MRNFRSLISLALLFSYVVGFAHSVIPHEEDEIYGSIYIAGHIHEEHHHDPGTEQNHFSHDDHCDRSLYDWILCFLGEIEHPENDCHFHSYATSEQALDSKNIPLPNLVVELPVKLESVEVDSEVDEVADLKIIIHPPPCLGSTSLRGPPVISC